MLNSKTTVARLVVITACLLLNPAAVVKAATYWVDPQGNDASDGSSGFPWQTIQHAVDVVAAGSTINVRTGVYSENVVISGFLLSAVNTLIQSAPGHNAILDGSSAPAPIAFSVDGQKSLTISGFEIRNYSSASEWGLAAGVYIAGESANITVADNNIHHIANTHPDSPIANGIGVYGTTATPLTNIKILNNEVHNLTLGWSESVVLNGNVDGFEIIGNSVHDNNNIGIDVIGYEEWLVDGGVPAALNRARNGVIRRNYVYNIDTASNPVYVDRSAGGIYIDGGTGVTIEQNFIHNSNIGIELASEAVDGVTDNITITDNELWRNHLAGIALGGHELKLGETKNVTIANNSFYDNATDPVYGLSEIWFQYNVSSNQVTDNIIHGGSEPVLLLDANNQYSLNTFSGNLYNSGASGGYFLIEGIKDHQTLTDPLFQSAVVADLRLKNSSPAQNAGIASIGVRTTDRLQRSRVVSTLAAPGLISPVGSASGTPTYLWNAVSGATQYDLWVDDAMGSQVIRAVYTASAAGCANGIGVCSVTPAVSVSGNVSWWIQAENSAESSSWSTALSFTVTSGVPGKATLISPSGSGGSVPEFEWNAVVGVTWYYLWADESVGGNGIRQWVSASQVGCAGSNARATADNSHPPAEPSSAPDTNVETPLSATRNNASGVGVQRVGSTCSIASPIMLSGDVTWWIRTWNSFGYGPWSSGLSFTVNSIPGQLILYAPVGSGSGSQPNYSWSAVSAATWYYLWVNDAVGVKIKHWYKVGDSEVSCSSSVCNVMPATSVTGNTTWWVRGWNSFGSGPWSVGVSFSP